MIFTISQGDAAFAFSLPLEGFSDSYSVTYEQSNVDFRTHPAVHLWKGGKLDDISVQLKLAVGIIEGQITQFKTSKQLVDAVAKICNWALPGIMEEGKQSNIDVVRISVGDGTNAWYRRQGLLSKVQTKWMGPWDIGEGGHGRPMVAELSLTIRPHFFGATILDDAAKDLVVQHNILPKRPWRFDKETKWGQ